MSALMVEGVRGGYSSAEEIVKGIDCAVHPGDLAIVVGPNGAGKSTLKLIAGLLKPKAGSCWKRAFRRAAPWMPWWQATSLKRRHSGAFRDGFGQR